MKHINDYISRNQLLLVVKPEFLEHSQKIINMVKDAGFRVLKLKTTRLTLEQAQQLYQIHEKEDFYNDLCEYMASGPSTALIVVPEDHSWSEKRTLDVMNGLKDRIRKLWEKSDKKNVMHSSDSYRRARAEMKVYF